MDPTLDNDCSLPVDKDVSQFKSPQFIFLRDGVFRPAQLLGWRESHNVGNLEKSLQFAPECIEPQAVQLVASVYLGPTTFVDDVERVHGGTADLDIQHSAVERAIQTAQQLAQDARVPYFSLAIARGTNQPFDLSALRKRQEYILPRYGGEK